MIEVLVFVAGALVVVGTLLSAIRTIVLPRSDRSLLTSAVFRVSLGIFRLLAGRRYERRDRVMAMYTPMSLVGLAGVWVTLVLLGYAGIFWAVGVGSPTEAIWVSGSSLLTLGSATIEGTGRRVLAFSEAVIGLGIVALLIAYLPTLYAGFSRRESLVALLEVHAGSPPSAPDMLVRFHRIGWTRDLSNEWGAWERWFVDVDESHTSYPALVWLRSPVSDRSWVTAAGAVLDAASIWLSSVEGVRDPQAALCVRAGFLALRRVASAFRIPFDHDPDEPISIQRSEFDACLDTLEEGGITTVADRDQAWADFRGWRVNYDAVLLRLAEMVVAPYAPWSSDRSAPDHTEPRIRWFRR